MHPSNSDLIPQLNSVPPTVKLEADPLDQNNLCISIKSEEQSDPASDAPVSVKEEIDATLPEPILLPELNLLPESTLPMECDNEKASIKEENDADQAKTEEQDHQTVKMEVDLPTLWFSLIPRNPCDEDSLISATASSLANGVVASPHAEQQESQVLNEQIERETEDNKREIEPLPEGTIHLFINFIQFH